MLRGRPVLCTIDGDGCGRVSWVARVLELIRRHPTLKFDVGPMVCVLDGTVAPPETALRVSLVQQIFALPNVEVATHSWSHPADWTDTKSGNMLGKNVQAAWDLEREVCGSADFIDAVLAPQDKPCRVFLLTGRCNPLYPAVRMMYRRGLVPFNGSSETGAAYRRVGEYKHYFQRAWHDLHYMGKREVRVVRGKQQTFRPRPSGYRNVIQDFRRDTQRPVHVYFHFYSAEFPETLASVEHVLAWCEAQPLVPLYVTEYVRWLEDRARG